MHQIRKNDEKEETVVSAKFKVPVFLIIPFVFALFLVSVLLLCGFGLDDVDLIVYPLIVLVILIIIFALACAGIKKSSCIVTNKMIKGVKSMVFAKKIYSYRLDEIDNVEITSVLGVHSLNLHFSQGSAPAAPIRYGRGLSPSVTRARSDLFVISCIKNYQEIYEKITELLASVKNAKDVKIDIEMSKVDAENKKAEAFAAIAMNMGNRTGDNTRPTSDYITQIKELKELLDNGIITQEEFEKKKTDLLK